MTLAVRYRKLILILLAAMLFLALAIAEVLAGHGLGRPVDAGSWAAHVRAVDEALARGDLTAAEREWREAYAAALGSRMWQAMIEVGDAYLRIGRHQAPSSIYRARARQAYLEAFFRARGQRSLEGVLRAAEAFAALGDRDVVTQCIRNAETVAGSDHRALERVRAFAAQLDYGTLAAGAIRLEP